MRLRASIALPGQFGDLWKRVHDGKVGGSPYPGPPPELLGEGRGEMERGMRFCGWRRIVEAPRQSATGAPLETTTHHSTTHHRPFHGGAPPSKPPPTTAQPSAVCSTAARPPQNHHPPQHNPPPPVPPRRAPLKTTTHHSATHHRPFHRGAPPSKPLPTTHSPPSPMPPGLARVTLTCATGCGSGFGDGLVRDSLCLAS